MGQLVELVAGLETPHRGQDLIKQSVITSHPPKHPPAHGCLQPPLFPPVVTLCLLILQTDWAWEILAFLLLQGLRASQSTDEEIF